MGLCSSPGQLPSFKMSCNRLFLSVLVLVLCGGLLGSCSKDPEPTPFISSFAPLAGPEATAVTISGANFSALPEGNEVQFNGIRAVVTSATSTQLKVTVPPGATSGVITLKVNGQYCVSEKVFTVNPLIGSWRFTGAASSNCLDALEEGIVACTFDCPTLTFLTTTIVFANSSASYTFTYTLSASHTLTISSAVQTFSPTYVIADDMLTLVYPPGDCSLTETYKRL